MIRFKFVHRERTRPRTRFVFYENYLKQNVSLIINMDIKMDNLLHEPPWIQSANKGLKGYYY